ncbi:telomere repeat binding factor (TRF) and Myb-like DNA-binding domain protein [Metarhizium robertsii]|uniref:Telomere repeat-binding factor, dimerization domain protein n=2 Tax=Metarhizium robertsii TaxID=568076 RepID=E9ENU1_METRA|nr:Telomere repeat-binding factor, dimerization domain protein [Metarhizium robertsii ARSEF 23]EFZ02211.1 Telomere repeat-binding factor, dimerization domain protein [Metarhizium robertsii ARSEF 23]EXV05384.1 telomere repeat binding factor (TRF) and Myb-like DNA-binding domain protein [Metarhizium robertsii]
MAESALAEASAFSMATGIKQEHEPTGLEGLDFALPPELASKRPFEEDIGATTETPEAKRAKTETETEEASLEDGLALLVQNALSNVGDLVDQFTSGHETAPEQPASDPMEVDTTIPLPEPPAVRATFVSDPRKFIRDTNVHALGNLALSLLLVLVQSPFEDTIKLVRGSEAQHEKTFRGLKCSFEHVHEMYSPGPVLSANELEFRDSDSQIFIGLANLAQLGLWLVDGTPKALSKADENFLAMFQCQLSELPPGMTELYLGIKTQRAIEFLVEKEPEKPSEEVIGEVLTHGLEHTLKEQHGGGELTSADQNFVSSVQTRKETLQGEVKEESEPAALREKHPAEDLLRSFLEYTAGRLKSLTDIGNKLGITIEISDSEPPPEPIPDATGDADMDLDDLSSFFEKTASGLVQNALAGLKDEPTTTDPTEGGEEAAAQTASTENKSEAASAQTNGKIDLMTDYKELEALVAESTSNYVKTTLHGLSPIPYQPTVPTSTTESMAAQPPYQTQVQHHQVQPPYYTYTQPPPEPQQPPLPGENLPPNQTFPSSILYDKARQAALSKSSAHTRREGLHSTRRPWTQEEEKALMAGLDMVKGPHWSQILTLFGQNGTISDILKDRTQVQLKDKARNLKLFFLKTNSEMPYYLQAVTGELKTRAPTQAARKEAEERARLNSEEDQAKLQGIMALAGGLQHPPQGRTPASPVNAVGSGVVTPAQAAQAASSAQHHAGHQANAAGQGAQATSVPRPTATPASQTRPGGQANTQPSSHSVAQANGRSQAQLPPQVPRPQGQPQHQQGHQSQPQQTQPAQQAEQAQQAQQPTRTPAMPQPTPNTLAQAQPQPAAAQQHHAATTQPATTSIPTSTPLAAARPQPITSPARAHSPQVSPPAAQPVPQTQPAPTPSPAPQQHPGPPPEAPKPDSPTQQEQDDNAAEAALLEGLQAVVAQSLAS